MDQDSDMTRFAHYGITTLEDEAEAEVMESDIITTLMTEAEARACVQAIRDGLSGIRKLLLDLYERQGWVALGYQNWRDCVIAEFGQSQGYLYRQLAAAKIELNISPMGEIGTIPERQLRPLTSLSSDQQRIAWEEAIRTSNGKPSGAHVQRIVNDLYGPDEHLDAAIDDESNPVCPECGQVYDGPTCPDCTPIPHKALPVPLGEKGMSQPMGVLLSHESTEWYTPPEYIEAARQVMGVIDLDPATAPIPQEWIKATIFYTVLDNGLIQPWQGRVWLNPPYSTTGGQSNQELWALKLIKEYEAGQVTEAILLVKASLGYNWFDRLFDVYPVCFKRGLISFINSDRESGPAKLGSAFFYLGPNLARFAAVFSRFGRIIAPESVT